MVSLRNMLPYEATGQGWKDPRPPGSFGGALFRGFGPHNPWPEEVIFVGLASLPLLLGCTCVVKSSKKTGLRDSELDSGNSQQRSSQVTGYTTFYHEFKSFCRFSCQRPELNAPKSAGPLVSMIQGKAIQFFIRSRRCLKLQMSKQTSDASIESRRLEWLALGHFVIAPDHGGDRDGDGGGGGGDKGSGDGVEVRAVGVGWGGVVAMVEKGAEIPDLSVPST